MDFHSLARRQLQCLCKKNKIPANITNLAMADALSALQHVEGLEEFMNPSNSDSPPSPARVTESRASAVRKPIREVQVSQPLTQSRRTRRTVGKDDEENKDANVLKTPAMPSSRRRAPIASACPSLNAQMKDDEKEGEIVGQVKNNLPQTPAMASSRRRAPADASTSVQRAYSTRRSVKLLEKTMAELSLSVGEKSKAEDLDEPSKVSSEVPDVVQEVETKDDTIESDMITLEEMDNISVTNENQDNMQDQSRVCLVHISEKDEKVDDEVLVTEVSSEPNKLEEVAKVLDEVPTVKSSLPQETEDLVKSESVESNQLSLNASDDQEVAMVLDEVSTVKSSLPQETEDLVKSESVESNQLSLIASNDQDEYPDEACENLVGRDSNVDVGEDDEHGEPDAEIECVNEGEKVDCNSKVADENPSYILEQSLDFSEDMKDSNSESECADEEEKDDGSKVSDEKASDIAYEATAFRDDDADLDFDLEVEVSDSENMNDGLFDVHVMEADISAKKKAPKCNQSKQTGPVVEVYIMQEAEFGVPSVKTPNSLKLTPFRAQLSGDQVSGTTEKMPVADNDAPLPYQFPRPSQATPKKSSSKKQATTQKTLISDDKENIESNARKVDGKENEIKIVDDLDKMSMRHLKKMLKELTLNKKGGDKFNTLQGGKMRPPLQILSDNQMTAAESEKN